MQGMKTGGRVKGTPNKLNGTLREMILKALDGKGGVAYLERQADENPTAFLTLLGKLLPTRVAANDGSPDCPTLEEIITGVPPGANARRDSDN